ncbi:MAG: hypothetical protein J6T03_03995 [Bacteroidales bacterium]|nr:hypothetical protein [Bacteroidales bacterium]
MFEVSGRYRQMDATQVDRRHSTALLDTMQTDTLNSCTPSLRQPSAA